MDYVVVPGSTTEDLPLPETWENSVLRKCYSCGPCYTFVPAAFFLFK